MSALDDALKAVIFICYYNDRNELAFAGTGFFLGTEIDDVLGLTFSVVVTAKHVILGLQNQKQDRDIWLRVNTKNGGVKLIKTARDEWEFHDSAYAADVAILFKNQLSVDDLDIIQIPQSIIVTESIIQTGIVGVGTSANVIGLFSMHSGKECNLPIVRNGNIAMLPTEPVSSRLFGDIEAYLIEIRSIGGLSGSPVFVYRDDLKISGDFGEQIGIYRSYYLLGLIHGHYDAPIPSKDMAVEDAWRSEAINTGIAIVVPATKILETLQQTNIVEHKLREREKLLRDRFS